METKWKQSAFVHELKNLWLFVKMQKNLVCCWEAKIRSKTCHWQDILGSASVRVHHSLDVHVVSRFLPKQQAWVATLLTRVWLGAEHYFGHWNDEGFMDTLCWVTNNKSSFTVTEHLGLWFVEQLLEYFWNYLIVSNHAETQSYSTAKKTAVFERN